MPAPPPEGQATRARDEAADIAERRARLGGMTFTCDGREYRYHIDGGNRPYDNERAVELAVAHAVLTEHGDAASMIEVGNVLPHYFPVEHAVLDKFEEHRAVTWNADVLEFDPPIAPELIVSISTLEHVGHSEAPRDPTGFRRAVAALIGWLKPGGRLFVTVPLGYNPAVLELLEDPEQPFDSLAVMRRVSAANEWEQTTLEEVRAASYGRPFPCANAIVIAQATKHARAPEGPPRPTTVDDDHPPASAASDGASPQSAAEPLRGAAAPEDGRIKIEIGAGTKGHPGFVHVDAVQLPGVDVVDDGRWLESFGDAVAEEIFAHWFFEHVAPMDIDRMLACWMRVLAPGGRIRLVTNNHEAHNRCLAAGEISWQEWTYLIYAVTNKPNFNVWDLHKSAWNQELLAETLERNGYADVTVDAQWQCREVDGRLKCPALTAVAFKPVARSEGEGTASDVPPDAGPQ